MTEDDPDRKEHGESKGEYAGCSTRTRKAIGENWTSHELERELKEW
jgi:hypothetical protein